MSPLFAEVFYWYKSLYYTIYSDHPQHILTSISVVPFVCSTFGFTFLSLWLGRIDVYWNASYRERNVHIDFWGYLNCFFSFRLSYILNIIYSTHNFRVWLICFATSNSGVCWFCINKNGNVCGWKSPSKNMTEALTCISKFEYIEGILPKRPYLPCIIIFAYLNAKFQLR